MYTIQYLYNKYKNEPFNSKILSRKEYIRIKEQTQNKYDNNITITKLNYIVNQIFPISWAVDIYTQGIRE